LDAGKIVAELKSERDRLSRAIEALEGSGPRKYAARVPKIAAAPAPAAMLGTTSTKKGGRLTAAGRKRLSEAMKRRWAERRKKG
jgi:hypothetical protein